MSMCKFCGGTNSVKNGVVGGRQRYKCGACFRSYREGDSRIKYSSELHKVAISMYLNSSGIRSIGRVLGIPFQLVQKWSESAGKTVEKILENNPQASQKINILEMNELYTYIQKKKIKQEYGLLSIGTETVLLRLTSGRETG
jgi:transposase